MVLISCLYKQIQVCLEIYGLFFSEDFDLHLVESVEGESWI